MRHLTVVRATTHLRGRRRALVGVGVVAALLLVSACSSDNGVAAGGPAVSSAAAPNTSTGTDGTPGSTTGDSSAAATLPYAQVKAGDIQGAAARARPLVYVPNQQAGSVQVIDPKTYAVTGTFPVGKSPEHVVPNHDLTTLWVNSDTGNSMTPIDPLTGKPGATIPIDDPYNLYFTPDGTSALVMAERLRRIDVRDPQTMALKRSLPVPCRGINHMDYTADLTTFVASCEFSGKLLVLDADATTVQKVIDLNVIPTPGATSPEMARTMGGPRASLEPGASAMPQDVRLSPDGKWLLAADMLRNGVWVINAHTMTYDHFVPTGLGAHGLYPSRDATRIFVSNRDEGSISVLDAATLTQTALWKIPGGGSPDMGGVSADGTELWISGRYSAKVYVFDTTTGQVTHVIPVRAGPHGLLVWPQPGRFSLGHTGNMR